MSRPRRVAVVAAKPPAVGKSRLALPEDVRRQLATAFALDVVAAVGACAEVDATMLMTTDDELAALAGVRSVVDPVEGNLNASLRATVAAVEADLAVALLADLPALRPEELAAAVTAARSGPAYVPDAEGTGTTCLIAPPATFDPRFGPDSSRRHQDSGARSSPATGRVCATTSTTWQPWAGSSATGWGRTRPGCSPA